MTTVVTINWNGLRFLDTLFSSLRSQDLDAKLYEIVMVDNASRDGSIDYVAANYPEVKIVKNTRNYGFAGGCNTGFRNSKGKYIILVNNDMELDKNWLKSLVEAADKSDKDVGAVVSKVMFKNKPGYINNVGSVLDVGADWPVSDRGFMEKDKGQYDKPEYVSAICGASVLLKRSMLEKIGIFDEAFFMYFEDADMSWRGFKQGWKYLYEPKSVALHEHTGSSKEGSPFFVFHVVRNRMLILLKHGTRANFTRVFKQNIRERIIAPVKIIRSQKSGRRVALNDLKNGLKIFLSFGIRLPGALLKRYRLVSEKTI